MVNSHKVCSRKSLERKICSRTCKEEKDDDAAADTYDSDADAAVYGGGEL